MVRPIKPQLGASISGSSSPPVRELLLITGHVTVAWHRHGIVAPLFGDRRHVLLRRCQTELWVIFRSEGDSSLMSASLTTSTQRWKHKKIQLDLVPSYLVSEFCSRLLPFHTPPSVVTFNSGSDKAMAGLMIFSTLSA